MLDAIRMIAENWNKVQGEIIINASKKSGLLSGDIAKETEEFVIQKNMEEEL